MGERKEEDLYRNFSRKDLQGLCKKYGLPANKSNSEMATSLILHLEKKNLSFRAIWDGTRSDPLASGMTELQAGVKMNLSDDQIKASHSGSGNYKNNNHRDGQQNDLRKCKGSATSDKASEDVGNLTQLHRESNSGVGIQENTFSSVVSSSVVAPSPIFTFDVCCEDGIQLYVDLNSSPSDWIENLKAGVRICHDLHNPMSQSFHQDIGLLCSSKQKNGFVIVDPSEDTDNAQLEVGTYSTAVSAGIQAQSDEPERLKSLSNGFDSLDNLKDEQAILSSKLDSGNQGKLHVTQSSKGEETLAVDPGLNVVVQTGNCCDFMGNSVPSDPKCSAFPVHQGSITDNGIHEKPSLQQTNGSLDAVLKCSESSTTVFMEMQASTCATLSHNLGYSPSGVYSCMDSVKQLKNSEVVTSVQTPMRDELQTWLVQAVDQSNSVSSSPLLNSHSLDLPDNKRSKVEPQQGIASFFSKTDRQIRQAWTHSAENAGFPRMQEAGRGTDGEQKKDATLHSCFNGGAFDLVVPKQNDRGDGKLTESNKDNICRTPSMVDVGQLNTPDTGNGSEGLGCMNFRDQLEIPRERPGFKSNGELKKKSHTNGIEGVSKFVNTEAKILRSSKQFVGDVHSKRRRSSRLFTK